MSCKDAIADLIRRLTALNTPAEAIAIAVMALVEAQSETRVFLEKERERKAFRRRECDDATWARLRDAVFLRDGYSCVYCGADGPTLHCDHIIPVSRGGRSVMENLATACGPCNVSKGARTPEEWRGA
jgi:5-methylcytosine-specific restriction endonuclease McrA